MNPAVQTPDPPSSAPPAPQPTRGLARPSLSQALLDSLPLGVLVTDQHLRLVQTNRWLNDRLGRGRPLPVGLPLAEALPELRERNLLQAFELVLRSALPMTISNRIHRFLVRLEIDIEGERAPMPQSAVISPLLENKEIIGTLTLINDVTERVLTERALHDEVDKLNTLHDIDRAIATLDLDECLQTIVARTRSFFHCETVALLLLEDGRLKIAARQPPPDGAPFNATLAEWTVAQRQSALVIDARRDPRYAADPAACGAEMAAPLSMHDECIGVLAAQSNRAGAHTADDLDLLRSLADRAAVAITNARLHRAERTQRELAETLAEISLALASELDSEAIFDAVLEGLQRVVPYDVASVMILENDWVRVKRYRGYEAFGAQSLVEHWSALLPDAHHLAPVVATRQPLILNQTAAQPDWDPPAHLRAMAAWACAPIIFKGQLLGFLSLGRVQAGGFPPNLAWHLATFAAHTGIVLQNARLYAEQQRLAVTDGLTGLTNRRRFDEALAHEIERAGRYGRPTALILLDIDNFKKYNDTHGHQMGDRLLQGLAGLMQQTFRAIDLTARYGGEEFVIILPESDLQAANYAAERLRLVVEQMHLRLNLPAQSVSISSGVAVAPEHAATPAALIRAADQALYRAKHTGKNKVVVWEAQSASQD